MRAGGVKSAERAMQLLEFFAEGRRPASVKEISQSLGFPQSSTSMLLRALADAGYYDHDPRTGMYSPSLRIHMAAEWIGNQLFSERSMLRLMQQVQRQTSYTVMVGVEEGVHVRYLHVLMSTLPGAVPTRNGELRPLFRSAAGKMLVTLHPEREIALLLRRANALEPDARNRLALEQVLQEREQTIRNGYSVSLGSSVPGQHALAILLPVPRGAKPLTLSVGGPMRRVLRDKARLLEILHELVEPMRRAAIHESRL